MKIFLALIVTLIFTLSNAQAQFQKDIIVTSPDGIWTDSRAYTTLNAAVTAVGLVPRKIVIASPQTVSTLTIPSNVTLQFERNGSITNTGQLTLQTKNILAEDRQIFTGAGDVDFAIGTIVRSSWFSTFSSAILITSDDSVTLVISKQESVSANITLGNNVYLKWESPESRLTVNVGFTFSNIGNVDAGDYQIFAGAGDFDFKSGTELNVRWFEHLRAALTWIETERVTIYISGTNQVDFTDAVQSNIILDFTRRNGQLSISAGIVLTINGGISSASTHIFTGLGTVVFGTSLVTTVDPFWFGILGNGTNDAVAFQSAITAASGRCLITPAGTYRLDAGLTYITSGAVPGLCIQGAGMNKTIFDNRVANGPMITLDGSTTPFGFARGAHLSDFSIITTTSPAASYGIDIRAQWYMTMERVRIQGLTSHGIKFTANNADDDSSCFLSFKNIELYQNGGWGVTYSGSGLPGLNSIIALLEFVNCFIVQNTLGGVNAAGFQWRFSGSSISTNGGPGILLSYQVNQGAAQEFVVENCEFDGNTGASLDFINIVGGRITTNKFVLRTGNTIGIRIGDGTVGSIANSVYAGQNVVRYDSGTPTFVYLGTTSAGNQIEDTFYMIPPTTKYADLGLSNVIREEGTYIRPLLKNELTTTGAASFTPDLYLGTVHRVIATAVGTFTINAPIYSIGSAIADGAELVLIIAPGSGGNTYIAFNAIYVVAGFKAPTPSTFTSAKFVYSLAANSWYQVGGWSAPGTANFVTGTVSYAPDLGLAVSHRIRVTATGAFTVANPIKTGGTISDGDELNLIIGNLSGGAIAVTFGAAIGQSGYVNPATGFHTSARFVYALGNWHLIGAWSAAF